MIPLAEKTFIASVFFYAVSLPLSMAGANFSMALLAAASLFLIVSHRFHWRIPPSLCWLAAFFLWVIVSGWVAGRGLSTAPMASLSKLWNVLPYLLIPMGSVLLAGQEKKIVWTMLGAGTAVVLLGALQYWGGVSYFFENSLSKHALVENTRFYGFQSHPLHTGALYSLLFFSALAALLFSGNDPENLIAYAGACLVLGLGVMLTGSRSYYLGLAAGSVLLLTLRGWKFLLMGIAALILFALILFKSDPNIENRMRTTGLSRMDESSFQRFYIWKSAGLMILRHPFAGIGYRNWGSTLPEYAAASPGWAMADSAKSHAHNSLLTVGAETGLIGLGIFIGFWIVFAREQISAWRAAPPGTMPRVFSAAVLGALPCLFVASLTEHNLLTATVSLALFFLAGLSRVTGKDAHACESGAPA